VSILEGTMQPVGADEYSNGKITTIKQRYGAQNTEIQKIIGD